jgi:oxygen-independent coproporphyrinogen-3 oxidase
LGKKLFLENGYVEIGMDHFALKSDSLYASSVDKKLHRNFMGYTSSKTQLMIGLGVSAISDSWYAFAQNVKTLEEYYDALAKDELPVFRGHLLNEEDLVIRKHVLNIMCQLRTSWSQPNEKFEGLDEVITKLDEFVKDGILTVDENGLQINESGIPFIRNVCMAFDLRMNRKLPDTRLFSMTI